MRILLMTALLLMGSCLQLNAQSTTANNGKYKIEEGTSLRVKSLTAISSKTASEGDAVDFAVYEDFIVNGKVLIKEGALVHAIVEQSAKARGVGKEGSLRISFLNTKAVDGTKVPLRATKGSVEGENKGSTSVALAVVVSPLFLLKKGKEAKIAEGKMMDAYVANDVEVTVP